MANLENAKKYFLEGLNALSTRDYSGAISSFKQSLVYYPNRVSTLINLSAAQIKNKEIIDAKESLELIDSINPNLYESSLNWGLIHALEHNPRLAIQFFNAAHLGNPNAADPYLNLAYSHFALSEFDNALNYSNRCLTINPNQIEAYLLQAKIFTAQKNHHSSCESLKKAFQINPKYPFVLGDFLHQKMYVCDWSNHENDIALLNEFLDHEDPVITPFQLLALIDDPKKHLICATKYTKYEHSNFAGSEVVFHKNYGAKIKLGYFSADFYNHAVSNLIAELFELHNQSRFEIHLFAFAPKTNDPMQSRIFSSTKNVHHIGNISDEEAAILSRKLEIDIAIDLMGYTTNYRADIFNYRCAPIQVSYLGYPSTMGAGFIDYLIADEVIIPPIERQNYSEKIAYIPGSYQINDRKRQGANSKFVSNELSLPEDAFIFCCFNNNYKINPTIFTVWMSILHRTPNSVLWLLEDNELASKNLRAEAKLRGVDPMRLIFAPRIETPNHLARQQYADLFLDTWPYNAHTTASDALWVGLPIISYAGSSFCSRVGSSLLSAVNLPELTTHSLLEYEELAVDFAQNPKKLAELKKKLMNDHNTLPLFNSKNTTEFIENIYSKMYARYIHDLDPVDIYIK